MYHGECTTGFIARRAGREANTARGHCIAAVFAAPYHLCTLSPFLAGPWTSTLHLLSLCVFLTCNLMQNYYTEH